MKNEFAFNLFSILLNEKIFSIEFFTFKTERATYSFLKIKYFFDEKDLFINYLFFFLYCFGIKKEVKK